MRLTRKFKGMIAIQIVHANVSQLIDAMTAMGISLYDLHPVDELTIQLSIGRTDWERLQRIAENRGAELRVLHRYGLFWRSKALLRRPVLIAGVALLLLISVFLPTRILFFEVQGNVRISDREILEAAQQAGICFGASRREIRSEQVKNMLLEIMPQLQWVGVNTSGSTAIISVTERSEVDSKANDLKIGSMVATRDGVIRSVTVTQGNALCVIGQAVKAGETLISAYTDCGLTIRATKAEGEIFAETLRELETVIPVSMEKKGDMTAVIKKYSLLIGKKRIKFYKDSGIYGTGCDKMYKEYFVTLPGGFTLPVALAVEQWSVCDTSVIATDGTSLSDAAQSCGELYLLQQMIAGQILSEQIRIEQDGEVCRITGQYRCLEMIGRIQNEEISTSYGQID